MKKLLTFFQQKISMYLPYFKIEILTTRWQTTLLSFEELGPDLPTYLSSLIKAFVSTYKTNEYNRLFLQTDNAQM